MDIREQWRSGRLPMPVAKRLPFRIVLSEFAERLASGTCDGLLDYLSKYISKRVAATLESSDVRELMLLHPSLLVLDGLDEVPSSTNRAEVLNCVRDFRIDATAEGIDILIIATSRPQGYNDDFSPDLYRHLYLVPLPPKIALEYAERLTQIRFGSDPARYEKVISRLKRASVESATARLMQSPLQVTIMTLLVDRMGQLLRKGGLSLANTTISFISGRLKGKSRRRLFFATFAAISMQFTTRSAWFCRSNVSVLAARTQS